MIVEAQVNEDILKYMEVKPKPCTSILEGSKALHPSHETSTFRKPGEKGLYPCTQIII
jgi:hypothetical protein